MNTKNKNMEEMINELTTIERLDSLSYYWKSYDFNDVIKNNRFYDKTEKQDRTDTLSEEEKKEIKVAMAIVNAIEAEVYKLKNPKRPSEGTEKTSIEWESLSEKGKIHYLDRLRKTLIRMKKEVNKEAQRSNKRYHSSEITKIGNAKEAAQLKKLQEDTPEIFNEYFEENSNVEIDGKIIIEYEPGRNDKGYKNPKSARIEYTTYERIKIKDFSEFTPDKINMITNKYKIDDTTGEILKVNERTGKLTKVNRTLSTRRTSNQSSMLL